MAYAHQDDVSTITEQKLPQGCCHGDSLRKDIEKDKNVKMAANGPRPITCFIHHRLTKEKLRSFLLDNHASDDCIIYNLKLLDSTKPNHDKEYLANSKAYPRVTSSDIVVTSLSDQSLKQVPAKTSRSEVFDYTILTPQKKKK